MHEVEFTDQFEAWWDTLTEDEQDDVNSAVKALAEGGPALRRPLVGEIKNSAFTPRMKELCIHDIRILFVFDPRQVAILLLGADKSKHGYKKWYRKAIEEADQLYREHLEEIDREG